MASYHARQRDPLLDRNTQAVIERRGKELLGAALVVLGLMAGMMLWSYTPEDPGWFASNGAPAQNALGRFGAAVASPLHVIAGYGAWALPVASVVWGLRFMLHRGEERALARAIFVPIFVALASVYAASLAPGPGWGHAFGLGGLFGDTVMGTLLGLSPLDGAVGLKLLAFLIACATIVLAGFVLGFDMEELAAIWRLMLLGSVMTYAMLLAILSTAGRWAYSAALALRDGTRARRVARAARNATRAEALALSGRMAETAHSAPVETFAPAPRRVRRAAAEDEDAWLVDSASPEPELVEPGPWRTDLAPPPPNEDRLRARIADAVKSRLKPTAPEPAEVPEDAPTETSFDVQSEAGERGRPVSSVVAAVAARIARGGPKQALARSSAPVLPRLRSEPPLRAPVRDAAAPLREMEAAPMPAAWPAPAAALPVVEDAPWQELPDAATIAAGTVPDAGSAAPEDADEPDAPWDWPGDTDEAVAPSPVLSRQHFPPAGDRRVVQHTPKKPSTPSRQALAEAQPRLGLEPEHAAYEHPPLGLLTNPAMIERHQLSDEALEENARMLETVLDDYGVKGEIVSVRPGPVVTMYELEPAPGLKASRVIGLADDIARSMSALSARVSTVPGRSVIGIELPNAHREKVVLREILSARDFGDSNMRLPLALGKDISGEPVVANLAKMPHLLIAGTTGSGKSVAINTMILSLLYKLSPEECRLIMIDPKMLELSVYDGIPHLLSPVVTDPKKAVVALKWVVGEMEERYRKMSKMGVRNIEGYNGRVREAQARGETFKRTVQTGFDEETGDPVFETEEFSPQSIPYIVVIVDEMADLMMVAGKEIEACIQRLAQMARASGIHLIMATQRPSVDVITGTIKANFPTRISFQVTSKIDSRTILGEMGAEQLLGMGDMLYMAGGARITRIHGPFVSDEEVEEIVNHLKSFGPPEYMSGVVEGPDEDREADIDAVLGIGGNTDGEDALYDQAVAIVARDRKCSTSYIQRKLGIGYNKAAKLVEQMEGQGVVTPANHVGKREILVPEA